MGETRSDLPLGHHLVPCQKPHPPIAIAGLTAGSENHKLAGEKGWIPVSLGIDPDASVTALQDHFKRELGPDRANTIDGIRATWDDGWMLIRASNTTANLTVRVEGRSKEALSRISGVVRDALESHPVDVSALLEFCG